MNDKEVNDNQLKMLTDELTIMKRIFRNYSHQLQQDNKQSSEEILGQLANMRNGLAEIANKLSSVVKHVLDKIGNAWTKLLPMIDNFNEAGYFSWIFGLLTCASTLVVSLFLLVPLSCTCFNVENMAAITFQMSSCVLSIFCMFLGLFTMFEALIGGHGEVFICRVLYEKPEFTVIGRLFDKPGVGYNQLASNGIISELLTTRDSEKSFANVTLATALGQCEMNKSVYYTFQLENLLDLKNTLDFKNYPGLASSINNLKAHESPFISFTNRIQNILSDLLLESDVNLTSIRVQIMQISPEKEMNSFIDQLQRVSLQISNAETISRMSSLVSSAKRIHANVLQPLEILKNEIIFQLSALELQIEPWIGAIEDIRASFNKSQEYLHANSLEICANYSEIFRTRMRNNLERFKKDVNDGVEIGYGCQMLFDIFDALRVLTCGHIIEPVNGKLRIHFFPALF
jgi:hypothetical protein